MSLTTNACKELQGPKMWEDLKSDEKIERTREEVKRQTRNYREG